jgi:hypothetical protein
MNLLEVQQYALVQADVQQRFGETAAARLWRQLADTAGQLTAMETRIAARAEEKAARIESWKR